MKPVNEIQDQIQTNRAQRDKVQADHETEIANLKNAYESQIADLKDRFESSYQNDRLKHHENLKNLKNQMHRTEQDLDHRKNELLDQKQQRFQIEAGQTEMQGKNQVREVQEKMAAALAYEQTKGEQAQQLTRTVHKKSAQAIVQDSEKKIQQLYEAKQKELESTQQRNVAAIAQIQQQSGSKQLETVARYDKEVRDLHLKTQADLDAKRLALSQSMNHYSQRQNDPFYRIVRTDHELIDLSDEIILKVHVPPHERDSIRVQFNGQELQVSGVRSHHEKVEAQPGNWISTQSFQQYSERIPLSQPVDGKTLVRELEDDVLKFSVKKFGPKHRIGTETISLNAKERREQEIRPVDFPKELPQPAIVPPKPENFPT